MLFSIVVDVNIAAPPAVIAEIVDTFADVAWNEAGRTAQAIKNCIYVQPSALWARFLETIPRDPSASLPIHDIPDGSYLIDPLDPDSRLLWFDEDGINVLGTQLGTPDIIDSYLFSKGIKHRHLVPVIHEVTTAGHPREAILLCLQGPPVLASPISSSRPIRMRGWKLGCVRWTLLTSLRGYIVYAFLLTSTRRRWVRMRRIFIGPARSSLFLRGCRPEIPLSLVR